jgi:Carbon-nitrogen hydrolase
MSPGSSTVILKGTHASCCLSGTSPPSLDSRRSDAADGYNSPAVFHRGDVEGIYCKLHPAIRGSVYSAGHEIPVFRMGELTFGIVICNDSNYREPASIMAAKGAAALFVPTNNGLPPEKACAEIAVHANGTKSTPQRDFLVATSAQRMPDAIQIGVHLQRPFLGEA